jgi:hypothetical protein
MHLGLLDGPFVPHNLKATQESPVLVLKFHMAPRIKPLMAHKSKKEPRYTFLVPQKPQQSNVSRFPNRAAMKREARLRGILHLSQKPHLLGSPVKEPSLKVHLMESLAERCPTTTALLHSSIKVRDIRAPPPQIPGSPRQKRGPHGERCPYPETFSIYIPGSTVKELPTRPPPRSRFRETERDGTSTEPPTFISQSPR